MDPVDYAGRLKKWSREGFKELGDMGGMGIGSTTHSVLRHPQFLTDPHEVYASRADVLSVSSRVSSAWWALRTSEWVATRGIYDSCQWFQRTVAYQHALQFLRGKRAARERPSHSRVLSRAALAWLFTTTPNGELARGLKEQYLLKIINHKTIRPKGFLGGVFSGSVKALLTMQLYTM